MYTAKQFYKIDEKGSKVRESITPQMVISTRFPSESSTQLSK